jgi:hypothetical protein
LLIVVLELVDQGELLEAGFFFQAYFFAQPHEGGISGGVLPIFLRQRRKHRAYVQQAGWAERPHHYLPVQPPG